MNQLSKLVIELLTRGLERFNLYYSTYRGVVVDNNDPHSLHRVKLQVPQVAGDYTIEYWAWPIGVYSNSSMGFQLIPKVGDMVWVSFELGNPRRPLWQYGYRGNDDFIEDDLKDQNLIWLRTKSGHKIIIDDSNKSIKIESSGGKVVEISDTISLGKSGSSDQSAVLGETLVSKIEELISILQSATVLTSIGAQPFIPSTLSSLATLKASIGEITSNSVTLDS